MGRRGRGTSWRGLLLGACAGAAVLGSPSLRATAGGSYLHSFAVPSFGDDVVAPAGDFDGDGFGDIVVRGLVQGDARSARILSGATGATLWEVGGAISSNDGFARAVAVLPDVDGRGAPDVLVGAPGGRDGFGGPVPTYALLLAGEDGAVLFDSGPRPPNARYGVAVASLGDLDGDGTGDFAVGQPSGEDLYGEPGAVFVHSGADGALLAEIPGPADGEGFGARIAALADLDGDGVRDFAVGSEGPYVGGAVMGGGVTLISGATRLPLRTLAGMHRGFAMSGDVVAMAREGPGARYFAVRCARPGDALAGIGIHDGATGRRVRFLEPGGREEFGFPMAGLGDVDGDGFPDLAARSLSGGAAGPLDDVTRVEVFSGATGRLRMSFRGLGLDGVHASTLSSAGDLDGDGLDELLVCFPGSDEVAVFDVGAGEVPAVVRVALQRPPGAADADARGVLVLGPHAVPQPLDLAAALLDHPGTAPRVHLEELPGSGTFQEVGYLGMRPAAGAWRFQLFAEGWAPPPSHAHLMLDDLAGCRVEVRGPGSEVLLRAVVPAAGAEAGGRVQRATLAAPQGAPASGARGSVRVSGSARRGSVRLTVAAGRLPEGAAPIAFVEDPPGSGLFVEVGPVPRRGLVRDSGRGDPLPGVAPDAAALAGRRVEVRDGDTVLVEGEIP